MEETFWDVLGIAETTDERAIKRAFAARLRITSPESDAAGYMKLRDAFEAAKHHAAMQRYDLSDDVADDEPGALVDVAPEPASSEISAPETSPQQQVFAELQALLSEQRLDDFLQKVESVQASQIFATLDEQHDFIGEVAWLVQEAEVGDAAWRGRLASLLGAREHDNIFSQGSRYWFAYGALLRSYAEVRIAATHAHAGDHDEVAATPGYLHVYHVLTAPFDSERLSALTRSSSYHRLAENLLERAKTDPAIAIPTENREWWERTAMAGQHRPADDPGVAANPASGDQSSGFPMWPIFIVLMLILNVARTCNTESSSSRTYTSEEAKRYLALVPKTESPLFRRIALCDPKTRAAIFLQLRKSDVSNASGAANSGPTPARPPVDENDPAIALLLAKCPPLRY